MALDWDNVEIIAEDENIVRLSEWSSIEIVTEDEEIIKTSDSDIINMDACDRMIIFSGQPGQPGPQGPVGPQGPPGYGAEWGNIGGTLSAQTDLQNALNAKANTADLGDLAYQDSVDYDTEVTNKPTLGDLAALNSIDYTSAYLTNKPTLGTMAAVNDAPSDNKEYARKNGGWSEVTGGGGGGSAEWGDITGTLSDQTDLKNALDAKANTADLGALAGMNNIDYSSAYLTNKPTLGSLASKNSVDYDTEVTNKPTLGTMAAVNDASSDGKAYARKDGAWYDLDGRYYTESEVDSALSGKVDTVSLDEILAWLGLVYYNHGLYVNPDQS